MSVTFITQVFKNLQNVNQDNMNLFYDDKDEKLTSYFINTPAIASGVGSIINSFGQVGTSNTFAFADGVLRFKDQVTVLGGTVPEATFASLTGQSITITASASPPAQLYAVAVLQQAALDPYKVQNNCFIYTNAMTLAQIAAQTNPLAYIPLFAITNTGGVYSIAVDSNCAFNYNFIANTPIVTKNFQVSSTDSLSTFNINAISLSGQFPASAVILSGKVQTNTPTNVSAGGQYAPILDLVTHGILSTSPSNDCAGSCSYATFASSAGLFYGGIGLAATVPAATNLLYVTGFNPGCNPGGLTLLSALAFNITIM